MVNRFVAARVSKLELFVLLYATELNPDEYVWNGLRSYGIGRVFITSPPQLRRTIVSHPFRAQRLPELVRSLFHRPRTRHTCA